MNDRIPYESLSEQFDDLKLRYEEAKETLQAIQTGQVDALVVQSHEGPRLYTLKSADHSYRVFIEQMKEGAVTLDGDGVILYCNSQFGKMVRCPLSEVIGSQFSKFVAPEFVEELDNILKNGWVTDTKGEINLMSEAGEVPVLLSGSCLELEGGASLSVIVTDLTVQKETEKQLKLKNDQLEEARQRAANMNEELEELVRQRTSDLLLSRERFIRLADNLPVIVWTTAPDGSADYFNKQWYEFTGLTPEESRGSGSQQALHPDDFDSTVAAWNKALMNKSQFYFEYRIKRASDGQYRWHLGNGEPLKDESGNVIAWFGISTDIQEQRDKLEQKDEFISVASHELRTPLTSLKGYIQLIEYSQDLTGDARSYIEKANLSLAKLQRLIDELLDASRIKAGRLAFTKNLFNLVDLVNACIENCNYIYPAFRISKLEPAEIIVDGNEERVEQVLMNLINNAVKYSPKERNIQIHVSKNGRFAVVSVEDKGIGMTENDQRFVFDRFYRVDGLNSFTPGLGMGLYIASEIVKEHGGEISVKSRLNEGSVFTFTLPLGRQPLSISSKLS